ncbi:glutamyl-tRNA amidotransferase [candidate division KSB3 bacterium]|uniref:Glutamyl-tRNA amidotransferase n=1 Tax=candidate division KSB3 bacterium TaxID=2044937 RepID=A0A2G6EBK5_9BACT|nr:MAG: glutamyl-tRNA amidotransferase [candidate division KSB3 bacterium]PIE30700.1 MAG: glutamyl-tRNA amidotransferase [candidate division KSB3 bacterium]
MTLKDRLMQDMKEAMKQKAQIRLGTIRQIRSTIKNKEIELMEELDDEGIVKVISTLVKQHKDSIEQFTKGGRVDLAEKEDAELKVLEGYMPQQMSDKDVQALVREAIETLDVHSMKDMGKVMKYVMPKVQGRADGKLVNQYVKSFLG